MDWTKTIHESTSGYVVNCDNGARYLVKYSDLTPKGLDLDAPINDHLTSNGDLIIEQVRSGNIGVRCLRGEQW